MHPFEQQLSQIVTEYETARARSQHDDASDVLTNVAVLDLQTRCLAAIERAAGRGSVYFQKAMEIGKRNTNDWDRLAFQIGVAKSLCSDIRNGYLRSLEELIHADVFGDFLEMGDHLLQAGYKDPAAVLAGSTLESHLRSLAAKWNVSVTHAGGPKKADVLNADLVKAGAYAKLDQKNVIAWLGLRNDAAHGNYAAYDAGQVRLLIASVRDFVTRNPA